MTPTSPECIAQLTQRIREFNRGFSIQELADIGDNYLLLLAEVKKAYRLLRDIELTHDACAPNTRLAADLTALSEFVADKRGEIQNLDDNNPKLLNAHQQATAALQVIDALATPRN